MERRNGKEIKPKNIQGKKIGAVDYMYDNRAASVVLLQPRTNSLPQHDRVHFLREDSKCSVFGAKTENLEHFLLWRSGSEERKIILLLQQPLQENKEQVVGRLLFEFKSKVENIRGL